MDIEEFKTEDLQDEFLKVVDELQNRNFSFEMLEDLMRNGLRK